MTPAGTSSEPVFPEGLLDTSADVVYFPVRHHSPAAARLVDRLIEDVHPTAVLIEGPSDFNDQFAELYLDHTLPIAIYSYVGAGDHGRHGAFYPFCDYSPEWRALLAARHLGVPARFIDLPWADVLKYGASTENRYADGEMRSSDYVAALCQAVGVEDLDALWDTMFEIEPDLTIDDYLRRCHRFCFNMRRVDSQSPEEDNAREAYMAAQIQSTLKELGGPIVVVTGGFHSIALYERMQTGSLSPDADDSDNDEVGTVRGIALTPYSYTRLDGLSGYNSGMPNPGFYHQAWIDGGDEKTSTCRTLLARAVTELRRRGQKVSAADLIAVETTASALASIRGHARIWRRDLIDGIIGSLIKDEIASGVNHPFLEVVYEVFRGSKRGALSDRASLPPLVHDIRRRLREHDLEPGNEPREIPLDLAQSSGLEKSRTLHALRLLGVPGIVAAKGPEFLAASGPTTAAELWKLAWVPEMDSAIIEASIYGASLFEAASSRLSERARRNERSAEAAALILLDAGQAGLFTFAQAYQPELLNLVQQDADFFRVAKALRHLLYLYRYDEFLGTSQSTGYGEVLREAYGRALWLLEMVGQTSGQQNELMAGVASIVETVDRCRGLELSREELVDVLRRVSRYGAANPTLCGAVRGALWTLRDLTTLDLLHDFASMSSPDVLGDFLTGLFHLARETVQRHPELVTSLDTTLNGYSLDEFMEALPSLRLAFSYFAPREKHHMARTLLAQFGITTPMDDLTAIVDVESTVGALRFEEELFSRLRLYGLRGGTHEH